MKAKISLSRLMVSTAIIAVGSACSPTHSFAADLVLPINPNVVGGASSVTTPLAGVMHVNQSTDRTVINWDSFNIGSDASVQFFQPDSNSLAVNRVMSAGTDPTRILGELKANGRIMVLDRNGVLFGSGSVVDVGGIVASTGDVTNASVMSGATVLTLSNFGTGTIENQGHITAADSGLVALVGPVVKNSGVIQANLGKVELAAGNETATIDLYGDGLISLAYTDKNDNLLAENTGTITAESGIIHMTAAAAKDVVDSVVNMDGIANATSATLVDGKIILTAKKVKVGNSASVTGPTQITAQTTELGSTINGVVSGTSDTVNVLSDNAKIGQALDIVTDGGNIYVASGTYNEDLTINTANIKLYGAMAGIDGNDASRGAGETLLTPHSPGIVVNADGVTVDGFMITGADNGIEVLSADNVTLKNNVITSSTLNGIYVTGSNTVSINGNKIDGTDYEGIYALTNTGLNITGNTILNTGLAGIPAEKGSGILLENTSNSTITGNDITGSLWDGVKAVFSDNLNVNNNTIYSVTRSGVSVENSANAVIDSNTLTNLGMVGVWSEKNAAATITNNYIDDAGSYFGIFHNYGDNATIAGNTVTASDIYGFYIRNSSNLDISNNTIQNTGSDGIYVRESDLVNLAGNTISSSGIFGIPAEKGSGILLENTSNSTITGNDITGSLWDGVKAVFSDNLNVNNNTIYSVTRSGVSVENSANAVIDSNTLTNLGMVGVWSEKNAAATITNNYIDDAGSYFGIFHNYGDNATIAGNTVTASDIYGFYIRNSSNLDISNNTIQNTGSDGIYVRESDLVNLAGNTISSSGIFGIPAEKGSGILLENTSNSTITGNDITGSLWDGVKAVFSDNLNVNNNTIYSVTRSGVSVENSANAVIDSNTLTNLGMVGVWSEKNAAATITNNYIDDAGSYFGIFHNYGDNATITGNTVTASDIYGFYIRNSSNLDISNNTIQNTGSDAALLDNVKGTVSFTNNSMSDFGLNGLRVVNVGTPSVYNITSNTIGNTGVTGNAGVYLDVGSGTLVNLVNNTIANNLRYGIEAYSGQLDLSSGINTIQNTDIGLGLYSTKGSSGPTLVGSTIGATHFIDQSSLFVDLGFDVMFAPGFPTQIDGMNAKYTLGGSTIEPSVLGYVTPAQYATLQTMIYDYNDSADRGLFFFPVSSLDPSTFFRTFSTDAATDGSGSLRITGLPLLELNAPTAVPAAPLTAANLNDLTPAAGGDETGTFSDENLSQIEPAAGGDEGTASGSPCWADANQALGQGQQVTFNFGGDANDLMNSAEACGNTL
ncbi:MAG: right-handed parallel beta-helix repeat-containing protein [Alphaproteobacteria bacterium]|nr:right-handed parallel beta-helix repeat-containing protein [Alphaproteobacteria bacterium]